MKNLRFTSILLLFLLIFSALAPGAAALDDPQIASSSAVLMETDGRTVLFSQNENVRVYPASTTKMMTVLLAVEAVEDGKVSLTDMVTATENMNYDLVADGSSAGIMPGETMSLEDLLFCAMLISGNDACNVIAEYVGGSISGFIQMMNERAAELGCVGTHFANTHGLPNENHYTTAWDFSLIALEAISHSEFMRICDTVSYTVPATNMSEARQLQNSNGLINENAPLYTGYKYEYAHGIKTGYTAASGYCLLSTAEKDGVQLLCVIMGGVVTDENGVIKYSNFTDSITLYEWGFANFSFQNILTTDGDVTSVPVTLGSEGDSVSLRPQNNLSAFLPNDIAMDGFEFSVTLYDADENGSLRAPISAGDVVGEVTVSREGRNYGTVSLVAASSIDMSRVNFIKEWIGDFFSSIWVKIAVIVIAALIVLYIISVVRYRRRRARYLQAVRARRAAERQRRAGQQGAAPRTADTAAGSKKAPRRDAGGTSVPGQNAADRDYFEEFFKK